MSSRPAVPALTFAVGDIHGCIDKLARLLTNCARESRGKSVRYIFIGDYVDRGPDTRAVMETLMRLERDMAPGGVVCLRGNHEQLLLDSLDGDESSVAHWIAVNGGAATLASYGVGSSRELPSSHIDWIGALPFFFDDGKRYFVHAGIDPVVPLAEQSQHDQLWMREPFLSSDKTFERFIVHGHTPTDGVPDLRGNRVNIDTAAVLGGPLTAAVFADAPGPIGFITD
jgi:serine/threonine protein phosphatase 1